MSRRKLKPDELALWQKVADSTERLRYLKYSDGRKETEAAPGFTGTNAGSKKPPKDTATFSVAEKLAAPHKSGPLPNLVPKSEPIAVQMDAKSFTRMKRGKLSPEARIDLHGMTLDQAHPALTGFILSSQSAGRRLVLVITGKGRLNHNDGPIPERRGILKRQVPQWLRMPPLKQAVLQISEAHVRHGGSGAFYVYLRRIR